NNNPIDRDQFVAQFDQFFPNPTTSYGYLDEYAFFKIIKLLGLPTDAGQCDDYSFLEGDFNKNQKLTLILSHIDLNPEGTKPTKHCSVLTKIDSKGFIVWTPRSDGTDQELPMPRDEWKGKQCYAVALY